MLLGTNWNQAKTKNSLTQVMTHYTYDLDKNLSE